MGEIILLGFLVFIFLTFATYITIKDFYFEREQHGLLVVLAVCFLPLSAVITYIMIELFDSITI
ncbi:hypothetical protein [Bacillus toyonensis]|uniref:hypothetical protein n=1 Tax=Bacillus toyonensis TaxID=155322 RepID=UPI001C025359|nr:hypothetical protein [Bacillus toyonensis]QWI08427.1 hypothetical protein EXW54_27630 [Bacillus toyonensis]